MAAKNHEFQAEVSQVLNLVINSLYRNKEIFLRELISNASDAIDKLRFEALTDESLNAGTAQIRLIPNADAKTLTIEDDGIGMSEDELMKNLGTIAHSGTKAFMQQLEAGADVELIGQFGVGFYSSFLVADRVDVITRKAGSETALKWSSDAKASFTIEPAERDSHGTSIVLHLADDQVEYTGSYRLQNLVTRYSDFVGHPIALATLPPAPVDEDGEEIIDAEPAEPVFETINQGSALWQRSPDEITDEQYGEFYKHLSHDWEPPLTRTHFTIEGSQEFTALLYVPKRAPFDMFDRESKHGVRFFVKRVFIMDDCAELLPVWLRFVRGVVDSSDLPLNVSRDVLQDSRAAAIIRKQVVKKVLDALDNLAMEKPEDYQIFWDTFGKVMKEGVHYDKKAAKRLSTLLRFESSHSDGFTSLTDYVERMPEGQTDIYYAIGPSKMLVESSPHLEAFKKKGYEVLYLTDPIDQWMVDGLDEFNEKSLVSVAGADLDLDEGDEEAKKAAEEREKTLVPLTDRFAEVLGDRVKEVKLSRRLADSPVCLVTPEGGLPSHIERMLRMQNQDMPSTPRVLELNPEHPIIVDLEKKLGGDSVTVEDFIHLLYDQALLREGSPIDDPSGFAARMSKLMVNSLKG
ncbi:MAG: molecular chaperone HtpG [Bradymonadia bacterium]|jgi:molecular chaperone HtpG